MFRSLSTGLAWIVGLSALILSLAVLALLPFVATALAAFAAGLGSSISANQLPPASTPSSPSAAPARVPRPAPVASSKSQADITQGPWLWHRTEYSNDTTVTAPDPSKYTVSFQPDGRLTLQVDCNRGTGTYTVDGPRLTIEPGATTLIACGPGSQDRVFLENLRNVVTYVFDGSNLVLNLKLDSGNMIFSPQPPVSLTGAWRVQSYNNGQGGIVSVLPDVQLTATFSEDGTVNGNAGCNAYRGPYTIAGDRITFGSIISTRRACLSQPLTEQERAFLAALSASTTYDLVGDRLTLRDDASATQVLLVRPSIQPAPSPAPGAP
jgi:heat shock protein HslJ